MLTGGKKKNQSSVCVSANFCLIFPFNSETYEIVCVKGSATARFHCCLQIGSHFKVRHICRCFHPPCSPLWVGNPNPCIHYTFQPCFYMSHWICLIFLSHNLTWTAVHCRSGFSLKLHLCGKEAVVPLDFFKHLGLIVVKCCCQVTMFCCVSSPSGTTDEKKMIALTCHWF